MSARDFLAVQGVEKAIADAVATVIKERPADAVARVGELLSKPKGPLDTSSEDAFNGDLMAKGISAMHLNLVGLGDELGYFRALAAGPLSFSQLAEKTKCNPRYTKEWCISMASSTVLAYNAVTDQFSITPAILGAVTTEMNPAGLIWATLVPAITDVRAKLADVYKSGAGIEWKDRDPRLMATTCNFFKPLYEGLLVVALPAEAKAKLEAGGTIADVGCGQGVSCCVLGEAFPKARVIGFDYHAGSIDNANALKASKDVANVTFEVADAVSFGKESSVDVCCFLDCFHDMSAPSNAAKRAFEVLKPGGITFLVEPMAAATDSAADQICLPPAPMFSAFSCQLCLACSMCNNGEGLGTICPTSTHEDIFKKAGFSSLASVDSPVNAAGFRMLVAIK